MDILCLSHLRWDFVFQRPQHLLSRAAKQGRVFYVEEPVGDSSKFGTDVSPRENGVRVVVPHVPRGSDRRSAIAGLRRSLARVIDEHRLADFVLWFYTPMALPAATDLAPSAVVYDCMDELSLFVGAPPELCRLEADLFKRADVVFTGGQALYEAKRTRHRNVHAFPSSVDVDHFARARSITVDPADQRSIPKPRLGFFGVIDERMDYGLVAGVAAARPDWHLVLVGPTAKIDPGSLPRAANIHYLGAKRYDELPAYIAGWDVATLPFARNDATRFISPTKTPEYLAAGKPVVSTTIRDVVRPYGRQGLARIADTVPAFVEAAEAALAEDAADRWRAADAFLSHTSWDGTWTRMRTLIEQTIARRTAADAPCAEDAS
jgi:UDP-galactopyranose mutase